MPTRQYAWACLASHAHAKTAGVGMPPGSVFSFWAMHGSFAIHSTFVIRNSSSRREATLRPAKRWIVAHAAQAGQPQAADSPAAADSSDNRQAKFAALHPLIKRLLANRGVTDAAQAAAFLEPKLSDLPAPEQLPGCVEAARLIIAAIRNGRKIVVYGDYDVDGTTGAAILWHAIKLAGGEAARVGYYVPNRIEEGYGLNAEALATIAAGGATMVITVDCGITAADEAQVARALGIELIVTDHHEPGPQLPEAACIVHPRLTGPNGDYPNPKLCGAGVAMKLAWAIGKAHANSDDQKVSEPFRKFLLQAISLAALGTVADVVPLIGENRVLVTFGLRSIKQTGLAGLDALIDSAGLRAEKVDAYHVGFTLAPRLNAAGRMDQARNVVEMLTEADAARSREIADYLQKHNQDRQSTERAILLQAVERLEADAGFASRRSIVLAGEWHPGVIGIVASRLVDRYHRPTVLIGLTNGQEAAATLGQGSARSVELVDRQFNMNQALAACAEHLVSFGGHAMAAGLRIDRTRIDPFALAFEAYAQTCLAAEDLCPVLRIDAQVTSDDLSMDVVRRMQALAPFGMGNPAPRLVAKDCRLANEPRRVGKDGSHLQFHVRIGSGVFKAIAFSGADWAKPLSGGRPFALAFQPGINTYQGRSSVELTVCDIQWREQGARD